MIINAEGLIAGRLASKVAKKIINKESITIINAEKAVVIGTNDSIMPKFKQRVNASVKTNPYYGPKYDRIPSKILKRMIKGMLPSKKRTAESLMKQLKVFNSIPKGIDVEKAETISEIKFSIKHDYKSLKEIANELGGKW